MNDKTPSTTTTSATAVAEKKVKVHFVAVGNAPILKKAKFQISAHQPFAAVTTFLRKMLKLTDGLVIFKAVSVFVMNWSYIIVFKKPGAEQTVGEGFSRFGSCRYPEIACHDLGHVSHPFVARILPPTNQETRNVYALLYSREIIQKCCAEGSIRRDGNHDISR